MRKQKIGAIILAGAMVLSMTGCGNSKAKAYGKYVTLGNYTGIEYTKTVAEVTDDDVQAELDSFVSGLTENEEVTEDRAVQADDIVNIDYVGTKDGEEFEGGSATGYDLTIGSGSFIAGFEDGLIGHKKGEEVSLDLTFPEDYSSEDLAGQDVNFKVTINSISVKKAPKLTDELVKSNTDYDTISAYKESIRKDLEEQNEESAEQQAENDIYNQVMENCSVSGYDEAEVDSLIDKEFNSFKETAKSYESYGYSYEDVLSMNGYTSEDELKEGITEYVKNYLKQKMVLYCIADKENIKVTTEEVDERVKEYMETYSVDSTDEVYDYFGDDYFEVSLLAEKVMDFLKENAKLVDSTEASSEESEDTTEAASEDTETTEETEETSEDTTTEDTTTEAE